MTRPRLTLMAIGALAVVAVVVLIVQVARTAPALTTVALLVVIVSATALAAMVGQRLRRTLAQLRTTTRGHQHRIAVLERALVIRNGRSELPTREQDYLERASIYDRLDRIERELDIDAPDER
ncbi:hypothetical protein ACSDQ9_06265 [Aestuariimicrobium soli]|uniref:hypothetical protein n=1 Tax=Aestuariimicrobium soli TaxID=2035834 RepID=UPI003EC0AC57